MHSPKPWIISSGSPEPLTRYSISTLFVRSVSAGAGCASAERAAFDPPAGLLGPDQVGAGDGGQQAAEDERQKTEDGRVTGWDETHRENRSYQRIRALP